MENQSSVIPAVNAPKRRGSLRRRSSLAQAATPKDTMHVTAQSRGRRRESVPARTAEVRSILSLSAISRAPLPTCSAVTASKVSCSLSLPSCSSANNLTVGHKASDCPNERVLRCRNCDAEGHVSKECPQPKDWSRVTCSNCGNKGHGMKRCPEPQKEDEDAEDAGASGGGGGGWDDGAPAAGGNWGANDAAAGGSASDW